MSTEPLISVVVPCRNEARAIANTVRAILDSDHKNSEVIVVDGMSEDGTRSILGELTQLDPRVRVVDNEKKLTPFARNLGVKAAGGEYIQIVDARNVIARDYLSILMETLAKRPRVGCVGGDFQHVFETEEGQSISRAMESKFGVGAGNYRTLQSDAYVDTVGIPMYRRSTFEELGYFDESLTRNQDDDFNFRVRRAGYQILYVHEAKATYLVRSSLKKAFKQYQQYGYFKVFVNRKHGQFTTIRQVVPAAFVAFFVLGLPLALFKLSLLKYLIWVAMLYAAMGIALAGQELSMADRLYTLRACFVLHVGYGTGYWLGIWDFYIQKILPRSSMQSMTT